MPQQFMKSNLHLKGWTLPFDKQILQENGTQKQHTHESHFKKPLADNGNRCKQNTLPCPPL